MTKIIYLDYNATAPLLPEVKEAMISAFDYIGNPSSVHQFGRRCRNEIDKARKKIAAAVDATSKDITFTSGGTEANHLALSGLKLKHDAIYASATEHASIYKNILPGNLIPVDIKGQVRLDELEKCFIRANPPKLVSIALANSETGIVQHHLREIVELCHRYGCLVHTDAVQAFGKVPLSFKDLDVDLMTISAHKIGGPKGVGALITKPNLILKASYLGGGQEKGLRSGTENIPAIVGFGVAAELASQVDWQPVQQLISFLIDQLKIINPHICINSATDGLPNTLNFSTPGFNKDTQVIHFDLNGIAVSAGAACSSGKVERSHVLKAMGIADIYTNSALRLSLSTETTLPDIEQFLAVWQGFQATQKVEGL